MNTMQFDGEGMCGKPSDQHLDSEGSQHRLVLALSTEASIEY